MSRDKTAALAGIRVIDLTRVRAGPSCCRILADHGADVIKVEAPAGVDPNESISGPRDGYDMQNLHRSKRSLTLNLKEPAAREVMRKLVATADVVVENYRPDVKYRLGVDYESLAAINPRVILASISGFGQDGPYAKRPGFDQIAQGLGGLMAVTGLPGQGPVRAGTAVADLSAGLYAATGILMALVERQTSGKGQWLHTSLLEAQIAMMDFQAARYLMDGEVPQQAGNDHPVSTPTGVMPTKNGHLNLGVSGDGQWRALCEEMGRPELGTDERFATGAARTANRALVREVLEPLFMEDTTESWLDRLEAASVPAGPIYAMDKVFADPQVRHVGMAETITHPRRGDIDLVAMPVHLTRTPAHISSPAPDAGEHTDAILAELGFSAEEIARLHETKAV
ncbi:CaiB/BaiF CoA transferase family protein [Acuticoccus mangrovi]|uniref:CoA transferase n=1 Tax=Acuticoccus mangrovi TaxID=2796142 RepID=A0A934ILI5_9HYPH|nr:CaiB/BaiF CoA-transferase family protein [Acuticoccus mangrovi]MBJ3774845.1 CoA transferase [Acuticoccus mangrovi]